MGKSNENWNEQQSPRMNQLGVLGPTALRTIPEDSSIVGVNPRDEAYSTASVVASSGVSGVPSMTLADMEGGGSDGSSMKEQYRQQQSPSQRISRTFLGIVLLVLSGVIIGVVLIIFTVTSPPTGTTTDLLSPASAPSGPDLIPSVSIDTPPFSWETDKPTSFPTYNVKQEDLDDIDSALAEISSAALLEDPDTPQGSCRHWLSKVDAFQARVNTHGMERVQQRYILCVLHRSTRGSERVVVSSWFVDDAKSECDWDGIRCDQTTGTVFFIDLPDFNLTGTLPSEIVHLTDLEALRIHENDLTGTIPSKLFQLSALGWVDLSKNALVGTVPMPLYSTSKLRKLFLLDNQFTGTIPWFPSLGHLYARNNSFTEIDNRYASSPAVQVLSVYNNSLQGTLPTNWTASNLVVLDLGSNQMKGPIPSQLWDMPSLTRLVLDENAFTGTLPFETPEGIALEEVWLYSNQLSGTIPEGFGMAWENLTSMLLHGNRFSGGNLESSQCSQWSKLTELEIDCNLTCACCTNECFH